MCPVKLDTSEMTVGERMDRFEALATRIKLGEMKSIEDLTEFAGMLTDMRREQAHINQVCEDMMGGMRPLIEPLLKSLGLHGI